MIFTQVNYNVGLEHRVSATSVLCDHLAHEHNQ